MSGDYYITTPIYYVSDEPRFEKIYTIIIADVLARYHRLFGDDVRFQTGTNEHGQKTSDAADNENKRPIEYCDERAVRYRELWKKLGISYNDFIRTTEERHRKIVRDILQGLFEKRLIYMSEYDGWYCVNEERFWMNKDLINGNCPQCRGTVSKLVEKNYFFKMSQFQKWLVKHINENRDLIRPESCCREVLKFLKQPLGDLCISRPKTSLAWGIDLPFDQNYVCYVWFEALINYISATGYKSNRSKFKQYWPAIHLINKDVLTAHAVYWPCILKALEIEQPRTIFTLDSNLSGHTATSGSRENIAKPLDLIEKYGVDAFRYYLVSETSPGKDFYFAEDSIISCYSSDLSGELGDLLSKVSKMIQSYNNGLVPDRPKLMEQKNLDLINAFGELPESMRKKIYNFQLGDAVNDIMDLVKKANLIIDKQRPMDVRAGSSADKFHAALYDAAEVLRLASVLLSPVMPAKCKEIQGQLGLKANNPECRSIEWGSLKAGTRLITTECLFPRL